jgi:hypothetical protein
MESSYALAKLDVRVDNQQPFYPNAMITSSKKAFEMLCLINNFDFFFFQKGGRQAFDVRH